MTSSSASKRRTKRLTNPLSEVNVGAGPGGQNPTSSSTSKETPPLSPAGLNAIPDGPGVRQRASTTRVHLPRPSASPSISPPAFGPAKSTGSKGFDNVKSVDAIIQRLNIGVKAGGDFAKTRFYVRTTSSQGRCRQSPSSSLIRATKACFTSPAAWMPISLPEACPRSEAQTSPLPLQVPTPGTAHCVQGLAAARRRRGHRLEGHPSTSDSRRRDPPGSPPPDASRTRPFEGKTLYIKINPGCGRQSLTSGMIRSRNFQYSANAIGGSRVSSTVAASDTTRLQAARSVSRRRRCHLRRPDLANIA